jgi:predicted RNA-binding Zn-ribbon protein involved in translation (DUF1610 family)
MLATARKTSGPAPKKLCPKCGYAVLRAKRACCGDRRRGIAWRLVCPKCGHKEIVKR